MEKFHTHQILHLFCTLTKEDKNAESLSLSFLVTMGLMLMMHRKKTRKKNNPHQAY